VVLYDKFSGRWIITDFAWTDTMNGPYYECIAVSKTADPVAGGWWLYTLQADAAWLNDYPKLGSWNDGIYMSANMFDCLNASCSSATNEGVKVWALDRSDLISGAALDTISFSLGNTYFGLLPANLKGAAAPANTPEYFVALDYDNFGTQLLLWKFTANWATPASSTFTGPTSFATSAFSYPGYGVSQPGGDSLDTLAGRLMTWLQYRNIGGTESLWVSHTVDVSGHTGVRWTEIRGMSGTPSVYQESTYAPDSNHRFMPSLAVNGLGQMAVGYSVSSGSLNPAIRYAGRLSTDPAGTLGLTETSLIAGAGYQSGGGGRWGDYSSMSVDPNDDCTFWYTTEYYAANGFNWQTRIGSFRLSTCAPTLSLPVNIIAEATSPAGRVVTYSATATDGNGSSVVVSCTPSSGSTFPLGTTTVNCSATDSAGNTSNGSFTVTIQDTTPPTLSLPANMTLMKNIPAGRVVTFSATSTDIVDVTVPVVCVPPSGSTFPVGTTTVNCSATDAHGNTANGSFTITILADNIPPIVTVPANMTVETAIGGNVATFTASATDETSPLNPAVTCTPASGSFFTYSGSPHTVVCSATDDAGNTGSASFTITLVDTIAPTVTPPANLTVQAAGPSGTVVSYFGVYTISDFGSGLASQGFTPPEGSLFPIGTTQVDLWATDNAGNTGHGYFNVTVQDTTPPALTLPANMTLEANIPAGRVVTYSASATDIVDGSVAVSCSPASGSTFPIATTIVGCSATDAHGNTANGSFAITIQDTTAPTLNLPANITVPQIIPAGAVVNFTVTATDIVDTNPTVVCVPPSGSTFPVGTTTVNCSATDDYNNTSNGSFTVTVVAATNLLLNPGYDAFGAAPRAWNYSVLNVPVSSLADCTIFLSPSCSLKLTSGATTKIVTQTVTYAGATGNQFSYGLFSSANNVANAGTYKVEVALFNRFNRVMYTVFQTFTNGTHSWELKNAQFTAPGAFTSIRYRIYFQKSFGTAWFDDAFLYRLP
jgi:hypothetical protein